MYQYLSINDCKQNYISEILKMKDKDTATKQMRLVHLTVTSRVNLTLQAFDP